MDIHATKVFTKMVDAIQQMYRIIISRGGTRSSKTYSAVQLLLMRLVTGRIEQRYRKSGVCSVVRKYGATIEATVMRDFEENITDWGLWGHIEHNKSKRTYKCGKRMVEFFGAENKMKVRGGKREILYCNEGNELHHDIFKQLLLRTTDFCLIDFNPDDSDIRINTQYEIKRSQAKGDVKTIVSTYKDNPYLPKYQIEEIEYLQETDPMARQVFGLGEYGIIEGLIFKNINVIESIPEGAKYISTGVDFGYTNDPTAAIDVYTYDNEIILDELFFEKGLHNVPLDKGDTQNIHTKLLDSGLDMGTATIRADSSEPKSIEEIARMGRDIDGTKKGKDSVNHGLSFMKKYKIKVTARSYNLIKEFRKYVRKQSRNGEYTNKPIDKFNHGIDAARYAIWMSLYDHDDTPEYDFYNVNIYQS